MAHRYKELHLPLDDAEKLRRYAQFVASKQHALKDALDKAKARFKHLERKVKECTERIASAEKEKDEAKEEAQITRLAAVAAGDAKAQANDELARVQDALLIAKEVMHKAKAEAARLEVERISLLLEIGWQKMKRLHFNLRRVRTKQP